MRATITIMWKDILSEIRVKHAINSLILFAFTTVVIISFSIKPIGLKDSAVLSGLFWIIVIFSAMMGLSRVFAKEEELKTINTLKLSVEKQSSIFIGKTLFNVILMFFLELLIFPAYLILMNMEPADMLLLMLIILISTIAIVISTSLVAVIISKTRGGSALFSALSFPIIVPVIFATVTSTERVVSSAVSFSDIISQIVMLISYSGIILILSILLFDHIWRD